MTDVTMWHERDAYARRDEVLEIASTYVEVSGGNGEYDIKVWPYALRDALGEAGLTLEHLEVLDVQEAAIEYKQDAIEQKEFERQEHLRQLIQKAVMQNIPDWQAMDVSSFNEYNLEIDTDAIVAEVEAGYDTATYDTLRDDEVTVYDVVAVIRSMQDWGAESHSASMVAARSKEPVDRIYELADEFRGAIARGTYTAGDLAADAYSGGDQFGPPSTDISNLAIEEVENIRKEHQEDVT
ncbi:hypothetical protein GW746_02170 [Candidatus Saccharibacteria bacterium]|nr:hypothetical protein [Candidatus Saccharibacteria bacterium]NCS83201.1 hypothetical protein [Candidatus Saccharibacteria bacterium]